jgi:hypothetical protein
MEDSKTVPAGLPVGQDRVTYKALKRAGCADLEKGMGEVVRMW